MSASSDEIVIDISDIFGTQFVQQIIFINNIYIKKQYFLNNRLYICERKQKQNRLERKGYYYGKECEIFVQLRGKIKRGGPKII